MERYLPERNPQNFESRWQRRWRHFQHYYAAPIAIAAGLFGAGIFGIPEGQRIIQGDYGKVTDRFELEKIMAGYTNVVTNPDNNPPINSSGGWLIDVFMGSGVISSSAMLGYGIYWRRTTRDRT